MEKGMLVPDEIVVMMVKERLLQPDAQENGWLLDGYPRSFSQAKALEDLGIRPDIFILLEVSEEDLVERVVGRRLDPVTGKIYHLKYSPPENEEIAARLTQRFDDTEEKVKLRLQTHHQNVEAVLSTYEDIIVRVCHFLDSSFIQSSRHNGHCNLYAHALLLPSLSKKCMANILIKCWVAKNMGLTLISYNLLSVAVERKQVMHSTGKPILRG
ncbi:hypothetical protein B296_00012960 [Ensete ventricosum]|uniref:adenylate kinase n=1 Tax=Ensete ventricosum TaxID=4639 RepID=A0A427AXF2_ENSVE|nr:hypothetical protein B296_00012960 [Ensete ventricosum]